MLSREWHNQIQILNRSYWLQIGRGQVENQVTSRQLQRLSKRDLDWVVVEERGGQLEEFFFFLVLISNLVIILLLFLKYVFIYLAVPGLGCRTQDLQF